MDSEEPTRMFRRAAPPTTPQVSQTEISELSRRVRMSEEKHSNLEKRMQVSEQNVIRINQNLRKEIKAMNMEMNELKREFACLKEELRKAISELVTCAKKEDVDMLKKYINLWAPVNFVTQDEVERMVRELAETYMQKDQNQKV